QKSGLKFLNSGADYRIKIRNAKMKMKPIAVGVCAMLMGVTAAHAGKITGSEAHAEGTVNVRQHAGVTLVIEEPAKAVVYDELHDGDIITGVAVTPATDAYVWVGYSQPYGDGEYGVATNEKGDTIGLWLDGAGRGDFRMTAENVGVSVNPVPGGTTAKNTLKYMSQAGELKRPGTYTYGLDAGYWND
ncbi:hypothetical protein, partial [Escherichia coli]|uniref:hypothetical protein n=1 Tax=Escherichia coli TaxID=562 RepID=UPI0038B2742F